MSGDPFPSRVPWDKYQHFPEDPALENNHHLDSLPCRLNPPRKQPPTHNPFASLTYFQCWRLMFRENRLFFFHQVMSGALFRRILGKLTRGCLCQGQGDPGDPFNSLFLFLFSYLTPGWIPNPLRPLVMGMFLPCLFLFYLNHQFLDQHFNVSNASKQTCDIFAYVSTALFIVISGLTGGNAKTRVWKHRSATTVTEKPHLKNYRTYCSKCEIIKPLRAKHCLYCRRCTPKYSKHSIVFNQCIGARNQLLYMLFQGVFFVYVTIVLTLFAFPKDSIFASAGNFVTIAVFFFVNSVIQGWAGFEFLRGLLYTISYNCTEYEVSNWSSKPYLYTFDRARFYNPFDSGVINNVVSSFYGFVGCCEGNHQGRIHNWAKTFYYYPSHIPGHAEKMQWTLYCQEQQQLNQRRHRQLRSQVELLHRIESQKSWTELQGMVDGDREVNEMKEMKYLKTPTKIKLEKGEEEENSNGERHKSHATEVKYGKRHLLVEERANKSIDL